MRACVHGCRLAITHVCENATSFVVVVVVVVGGGGGGRTAIRYEKEMSEADPQLAQLFQVPPEFANSLSGGHPALNAGWCVRACVRACVRCSIVVVKSTV